MATANFSRLMLDAGLPELAKGLTRDDEQFQHVVIAGAVALSDGDIALLHEPFTDNEMMDLFGVMDYRTGRVVSALHRMARANRFDQTDTDIYAFQEYIAELWDLQTSPLFRPIGRSVAQVNGDSIVVDNRFLVPREQTPRIVLEYGACTSSRSIVADQVKIAENTGNTFVYSPITNMHFTNRILMQTYDRLYGVGSSNHMIRKHLYIGREDGTASATDEMIALQTQHTGRADFADVILMIGSQHMEREDVERGIKNAGLLLSSSGVLIARAPEQPSGEQVGIEEIEDLVRDSGLIPAGTMGYDTTDHITQEELLLKGPGAVRKMRTTAFTRPSVLFN